MGYLSFNYEGQTPLTDQFVIISGEDNVMIVSVGVLYECVCI